MLPFGRGLQGEELSAKEAIFAKLKAKAARSDIAFHPLTPRQRGIKV
jgi:hypothetical protein